MGKPVLHPSWYVAIGNQSILQMVVYHRGLKKQIHIALFSSHFLHFTSRPFIYTSVNNLLTVNSLSRTHQKTDIHHHPNFAAPFVGRKIGGWFQGVVFFRNLQGRGESGAPYQKLLWQCCFSDCLAGRQLPFPPPHNSLGQSDDVAPNLHSVELTLAEKNKMSRREGWLGAPFVFLSQNFKRKFSWENFRLGFNGSKKKVNILCKLKHTFGIRHPAALQISDCCSLPPIVYLVWLPPLLRCQHATATPLLVCIVRFLCFGDGG